MINFYKSTEAGITMLDQVAGGSWMNVTDPTPDEITWLQEQGLPNDYIIYPLDIDERPRTEKENGVTLIVLRIPYFQGHTADVPYTTIPLGIILNDQYVVTICKREVDILREFASGKARGLSTGKRYRFLLRLLLSTASRYLAYLREINKVVDVLEDQLQRSTRNREVLELLKYQKSLTFFTTALKSNQLLLERLQRSQLFKMFPEDEDLLEDVITENQQAIEMTNIAGNILSQMMDAFASIISNNLNAVMKFLASVTIVLSLPTMVASFYGMNVNLPLDNHPQAFVITLAISFFISLSVAFIFWRRDWF